jgi:alkanesulfonate monooxygenase SsuD/methylene tetrahydromethanopterin reductase-like flavin-dependent oxidoreductase (luciferase family)
MKVGLFLNTQFPPGTDMQARVPEMVAQVRAARDCGFSSLWFPHHYVTAPLQMFQLTALMPFLLAEAKGMTVGGDIIILPLLHPVSVAEEAATLDVLSGGNYVLGVGLGYRAPEFTAFGIPLSERAPRFSESIGLIRRLWTEDRVTHVGKFYTVEDAGIGIKPIQPGGPPIWIAAKVDAALKRAARIGDAWLIVPSSTCAELVPQMRFYRDALRAFGKPEPSDFPLTRECYVGTSQATALEECRAALTYKYKAYASWGLYGDATQFSIDEFARDRFIIGDESFVSEEIARYRETLGVNHFIMRMQWPGLPQERVLHSIRALGRIFSGAKGEK